MDDKRDKDIEKSEIINDEKYSVEVAKDFTIQSIPNQLIDVDKEITGYTAGLITRDLVSRGEEIVKDKNNKQKK